MSRKIWIASGIAGILAVSALSFGLHAGEHRGCGFGPQTAMHGHHGEFTGPMPERMAKHLDMSDEQSDAFFAIVDETRPAMQSQFEAMKQTRQATMALDPESENYLAELQNLAEQQSQQLGQLIVSMGETRQRVHALLTVEQKAKVREFAARGPKRGPWH